MTRYKSLKLINQLFGMADAVVGDDFPRTLTKAEADKALQSRSRLLIRARLLAETFDHRNLRGKANRLLIANAERRGSLKLKKGSATNADNV